MGEAEPPWVESKVLCRAEMFPRKDVHAGIPGTHDCVRLDGKEEVRGAYGTEVCFSADLKSESSREVCG